MGIPAPIDEDEIERDVDACVEACGGDMRATIKALMIANAYLEEELRRVSSAGYMRRKTQ